jgi:hypothetical protein
MRGTADPGSPLDDRAATPTVSLPRELAVPTHCGPRPHEIERRKPDGGAAEPLSSSFAMDIGVKALGTVPRRADIGGLGEADVRGGVRRRHIHAWATPCGG